MKFSEMPYERIDMEDAKQKMQDIMKEFANCGSGEEQFEVHSKNFLQQHCAKVLRFQLFFIYFINLFGSEIVPRLFNKHFHCMNLCTQLVAQPPFAPTCCSGQQCLRRVHWRG